MGDDKRGTLMFVVFGRPGAGKTTISQAAVNLLGVESGTSSKKRQCLYLDLDVCVPQWMRDNFSKGIYPTLQQRAEFISTACDYVQGEITISATTKNGNQSKQPLITIVSFSFVNADLRVAFREAFPLARWMLVNTDEGLSARRISAREGHFYKNDASPDGGVAEGACGGGDDDDNSEWKFRPVDFPHVILDGREPVETNAKRIVDCISKASGLELD